MEEGERPERRRRAMLVSAGWEVKEGDGEAGGAESVRYGTDIYREEKMVGTAQKTLIVCQMRLANEKKKYLCGVFALAAGKMRDSNLVGGEDGISTKCRALVWPMIYMGGRTCFGVRKVGRNGW